MRACDNLNLCAGLKAGIEGAVHALRDAWEEDLHGPPQNPEDAPELEEEPPGDGPAHTPLPDLLTQPIEPEESDDEEADPHVVLLVNATNGFNELGRKAALWTVRHGWAAGAQFAFNCYWHSATLILRRPGRPDCYTLQSREGVTQGDPLAMVIYGLALTPLSLDLSTCHPRVLQPWYADDAAMEGRASNVAAAMASLIQAGSARGYFPSPEKSIMLVRPADQAAAKSHLEDFQFTYQAGVRYLGSFLGTKSERDAWLATKIDTWISTVWTLGKIAKRYPQTSYAGMARSLQMEWQYTLHVIPDVDTQFESLARVIAEECLPALLSEPAGLPEGLRERLTLPARWSGMGIPDPARSPTSVT
jgi:hypothetical protein